MIKEGRSAIIISASSDIGAAISRRWLARGWSVFGTYRTKSQAVSELQDHGVQLVYCNLSEPQSVHDACSSLRILCSTWDILVMCPGTQEPVGAFIECSFDEWEESVRVNFISQMRIIHELLPTRCVNSALGPCVLLFAGGGTNSAPVNYSAYTISKVGLIKMCELLDAEISDARFVVVGPGWVKTKIHDSTLRAGARASANMITGVCCAYYDSVPVIYITGQVTTFRMKRDSGVRQLGFQETDTAEIYKPITKYAVLIDNPERIRFELEKATYLAKSGRPGPVLIDIADDVQRAEIEPDRLESFVPKEEEDTGNPTQLHEQVRRCIELLNEAEMPVLIFGWGVRLAKAEGEAKRLVEALGFPVALTWAVMDMLSSNHPLVVGAFGTHGTRYGNFTVQNADLILVVGARLDTREAGSPISTFAREAKKIVVDIDISELNKFKMLGMSVDVLVHSDARDFLQAINRRIDEISPQDISDWKKRIEEWKAKFPICPPEYYKQEEVNPYVFVKTLSKESKEGDVIVVDTGCAIAWMMQAFEFKPNQRLFHDFNNTAMGYALPASIGACFALDGQPITCVTGDGSLQMNIQELATVVRHQLPIKIFLINNHGYSMIRQTQDQWMGSNYLASTVEGGLAFPDFVKVADAYSYKTATIDSNRELHARIREVLDSDGPVFCNVEISPEHRVIPQTKFGRPIEDAEPLLDRREFLKNMIVKPVEASLT